MSRQGKFARLPHALRLEVNTRLLNGESGPEILAWLNQEKDAIQTWNDHFDGKPANAENLSAWRKGGYKDWLKKREKVENLKSLSHFSLDLAKAGKSISDGAAAIAAGKLMQAFEQLADDEDFDIVAMSKAVASIRKGDRDKDKAELEKAKHQVKKAEVALSREKFEVQTAEQFLKWAKTPEAQAILNNGKKKGMQISELRKLMFG